MCRTSLLNPPIKKEGFLISEFQIRKWENLYQTFYEYIQVDWSFALIVDIRCKELNAESYWLPMLGNIVLLTSK